MSGVADLQIAEALVLRPGDKLVLRTHPDVTRQAVEDLASAVKEKLPDIEVCVIAGVDQMLVYRPAS